MWYPETNTAKLKPPEEISSYALHKRDTLNICGTKRIHPTFGLIERGYKAWNVVFTDFHFEYLIQSHIVHEHRISRLASYPMSKICKQNFLCSPGYWIKQTPFCLCIVSLGIMMSRRASRSSDISYHLRGSESMERKIGNRKLWRQSENMPLCLVLTWQKNLVSSERLLRFDSECIALSSSNWCFPSMC